MANVQFYKLGSNSGVKMSTYEQYKKDYPTSIIFAKVKELGNGLWDASNKTLGKPSHYIYANGLEYKVADADALEYVFSQVNTLIGDVSTEGSVRYLIEQALKNYKLTARDVYDILDPSSNVDASIVTDSEGNEYLRLTASGGDANVKVFEYFDLTPEEYITANGLVPEKGWYYIKKENVIDPSVDFNSDAEPMRTAYVYDGEKWTALSGNVSAEHVYFPNGIDRTAAWGVQKATTNSEIVNECKNYNLREVMDFYLIEEVFPSGTKNIATFSDRTLGTLSYSAKLKKAEDYLTWENKSKYPVQSGTIKVPYGTKFTVNDITLDSTTVKVNKNNFVEDIKEGTFNSITGLTYGYKETIDGEIKYGDLVGANKVSATYSYTDNLDDATATLKSIGFGVKSTDGDTQTITGLNTAQELKIAANDANVAYATATTQTFTVSLDCNANASRTITYTPTNRTAAGIETVYIVSNKGNVYDKDNNTHPISLPNKTFTASTNNTIAKPTVQTVSVNIQGVWPVYYGWSTDTKYQSSDGNLTAQDFENIDIKVNHQGMNIENEYAKTYTTVIGLTLMWIAIPIDDITLTCKCVEPPAPVNLSKVNMNLSGANNQGSKKYTVVYFCGAATKNANKYTFSK